MVTVFKNISDIDTPIYKNIDEVLARIQRGNSKDLVQIVRDEPDKKERDKLKKGLPSICFSGKFDRRADDACTEHSGFICLDFDGFESETALQNYRTLLTEDDFTYSLFTSPSGDGIKLIVRIPPSIANHKKYFKSLQAKYDSPHFDRSCVNISRVCYESYDPEIYTNEFSLIWEELPDEEGIDTATVTRPIIKIDNEDKVIERLLKWWTKKHGLVEGSRNHNLYFLCQAFKEYGVAQHTALYEASKFAQSDFPVEEIKVTVWSAYKDMSTFGTKVFEDTDLLDEIQREVKSGKTVEQIVEAIDRPDKEQVKEVVKHISEENTCDVFWTFTSKGAVRHVPNLYCDFLKKYGFYKYYHTGAESFIFIRIVNNLITQIKEDDIKDFVLHYLDSLDDKRFWNYFADTTRVFKEDFLSLLPRVEAHFVQDTAEKAHIFYRNCALEITKEGVTEMDYIDLNGFIWKDQIIDREFRSIEYEDSVFRKFVTIIGGDRLNVSSIESTIGFLLHSFKPREYCPAIILNDERISDNPEGGTGKGLLFDGVSQIKRTVIIDGKSFKFDKAFLYQTVSAGTQVLLFDDVDKNFSFEKLFSVITGGLTVEKKNKDAIRIPFDVSPKIGITTNYAIIGDGNSFDRRKWELELKQYFTKKHTPMHEFGGRLFDDWSKEEWLKFDNYMMSCLVGYLNTGFIESQSTNIETRKFIQKTNFYFYEFATSDIGMKLNMMDHEICLQTVFNDFVGCYSDFGPHGRYKLTQITFYKWCEAYAEYKTGDKPQTGRNATGRYMKMTTPRF